MTACLVNFIPEDMSESKDVIRLKYKQILANFINNELIKAKPIDGKKILDLKQWNIKNKNGIEIAEFLLIYDPQFLSRPYTIKIKFNITDLLPSTVSAFMPVIIEGKDLNNAIDEFISTVNKKVYCRDCGRVYNIDKYCESEEQCLACVLETLLWLDKIEKQFCTICQSETTRFIQLKCGHYFHRKCISKVLKNSCPQCRSKIEIMS